MKDIYNYKTSWPVYGLSWCRRPGSFRLAFGSFIEEYKNQICLVDLNQQTNELSSVGVAEVHYPITKLLWSPFKAGSTSDIFATTGDYLRIWEVKGDSSTNGAPAQHSLTCRSTLANVRKSGHAKKGLLCTIDFIRLERNGPIVVCNEQCGYHLHSLECRGLFLLEYLPQTGQAKTQLIAHDREVYDVAFARGTDIFASVGADGSVRMFDLRSLEHSTIIYETANAAKQAGTSEGQTPESLPLLRLAWNKQDPNYLATIQMESSLVLILDIRVPATPVFQLSGHTSVVNSIAWAPHSSSHICSVGKLTSDDSQALVWDIAQGNKSKLVQEPILAYNAEAEINQVSWNSEMHDWIAIGTGSNVQALKV